MAAERGLAGREGVGAGLIPPAIEAIRRLPAVLLLVAAALAVAAALRIPGAASGVWWSILPVDPADPDRLVLLATAAAIAALGLGLARSKRAAFLLAVASLGAAVVAQGWLLAHPVGGLVAAGCLAILVTDRHRYVVGAPRSADRLLLALVATALLTTAAGVAIGILDGRLHLGPADDALLALKGATTMVSLSSVRPLVPLANGILLVVLAVVARTALAVGAAGILRPPARAPRPASPAGVATIRRYARGGLVPFLLGPDVSTFEPAGLDAVVVHAVEGRWAVALGDPVGPEAEAAEAWRRFADWCGQRDLVPAVYQASDDAVTSTLAGWRAFRVGLEAVVDLRSFDLGGSRRANLRHTVTRAQRGGVRVAWWPDGLPRERGDLERALTEVDRGWAAARPGPSLGFTVGRFDPAELHRTPIAVALGQDDRPMAFATFRPTGGGGWVLELMRRIPGSVPGAFEACVTEAASRLAAAGATELSLGLAPLAGLRVGDGPVEERLLALAARLARPAYDVAGLEFFKRKFDPRWEPRYVVVRHRLDVLGLGLALLRLHLGPGGLRSGLAALVVPHAARSVAVSSGTR